MSERKVVRRNLAVTLGIICIILAVGLVGVFAYYTMTLNNKNSAYDNYVSNHGIFNSDYDILISQNTNLQTQVNQLQAWLDGNKTLLNQTETWLDDNITYYNSQLVNLQNQNTDLQNQIADLQAPKLVEVNLKAEDNRPAQQQTYLHVYGYVCNVGTDTAYNATLYVEAFQGVVLTFNTTISLGTINGGNYTSVDSQVVYPGYALTAWQVWSSPTGINHSWGS